MHRKSVVFIADNLDSAHKFQTLLAPLDVDVATGSSMQFQSLLSLNHTCDLVIFELQAGALELLSNIEDLISSTTQAALLVIVDDAEVRGLHFSMRVKSDFVVRSASSEECSLRVRQLLGSDNKSAKSDIVVIDNMVVNLATYQVRVNDIPLDFTYLEYALLAFLVTHPGRTYSRDALLSRVWGFDYYGGSRTVDVHVRRIRAKIGPELAHHLETVRGVGYLWNK